MASTDALPIPRKNVAFRVTFPLLDADGDLVTAATGLDSEVSKDGGTFADCTNEATEIATASGMYYLDLTSTEMNADTVAIIVKTSSTGAKTTAIVLYPATDTELRCNIVEAEGVVWSSGSIAPGCFSSLADVYQAKIVLVDDDSGTTDRYIVTWFKNGVPQLSGITSPTIQVIKVSDGSDLIASTALTEIGSLQMFKYDATSSARIVSGAAYIAKVTASIASQTRTWVQPIGRDST